MLLCKIFISSYFITQFPKVLITHRKIYLQSTCFSMTNIQITRKSMTNFIFRNIFKKYQRLDQTYN